jgi:hypothetical protein
MIDLPDLDPQDTANRVLIRDQNKHIRAAMYGSTRRVRLVSQAAGYGARFIEDCETTTQWSVGRVARWSRLLEHKFRITIEGLIVPNDDDLTAALLEAATPFGGADEDFLHVRAVVNDLSRVQQAQGITDYALGKRIGCSNRAIARWVEKPEVCYLKTVQRYARGLGEIQRERTGVGGHLALEVVPVTVAVPA